jgi:DNA-directed RNA polymerase specialized sigma24 family protein
MHRDPPVGELADAATLALLLALNDLPPRERLAYILRAVFGVPDDEVAALLAANPTTPRG